MSHRVPVRASTETPIERIFEKVMRRKMTPEEREVLHLNNGRERILENSNNGAGLQYKNGAKLTSI
jgi:hypothetical protein